MKRILFLAVACFALSQIGMAEQFYGEINTNANTVKIIGGTGRALDLDSPIGAFAVGFGTMVGFLVLGLGYRMVKGIAWGHGGDVS